MNAHKCARCGGMAYAKTKSIEFTYDGKKVIVDQEFLECEDCKLEYTTNELDEITINKVKQAMGYKPN